MGEELELVGSGSTLRITTGPASVVGREGSAALPVYDDRVSRRHASVRIVDGGLEIEDLGSTNGTFLNGQRIEKAVARLGDTVLFGGVGFRVEAVGARSSAVHSSRILRSIQLRPPKPEPPSEDGPPALEGERYLELVEGVPEGSKAKKLAALVDVATHLSQAETAEALFRRIAGLVLRVLEPDRMALFSVDGEAMDLVAQVCRDRRGRRLDPAFVPRELVFDSVAQRLAVRSENLAEDERFAAESVARASSVLCLPLLGVSGDVLAVLYLERDRGAEAFDDEDLNYVAAMGSVAGAALSNRRLRQEIAARGERLEELERVLAPEGDAPSPVTVRPGLGRPRLLLLVCRLGGVDRGATGLPLLDEAIGSFHVTARRTIRDYGGAVAYSFGAELGAVWGLAGLRDGDPSRALRAATNIAEESRSLVTAWKRVAADWAPVVALHVGEVLSGRLTGDRETFVLVGQAFDAVRDLAFQAAEPLVASRAFLDLLEKPPPTRRARLEGAWRNDAAAITL